MTHVTNQKLTQGAYMDHSSKTPSRFSANTWQSEEVMPQSTSCGHKKSSHDTPMIEWQTAATLQIGPETLPSKTAYLVDKFEEIMGKRGQTTPKLSKPINKPFKSEKTIEKLAEILII